MEISMWNFIGPFIFTLLITLLTAGFIVSKTATLSPAENLRSE
jgi:ABC-type antimicrobial peptide transport system permease subunit